VRLGFSDLSARGLTPRRSQPVEFNLRGKDYAGLDQAARDLMAKLGETGLMVDLDSSYKAGMPELRIWPDREAAAQRGVPWSPCPTPSRPPWAVCARASSPATAGATTCACAESRRSAWSAEDLKRLQVRTSFGELVPLADVVPHGDDQDRAKHHPRQPPARHLRHRQPGPGRVPERGPGGGADSLARANLPPGYSFYLEGGAQTFQESFNSLWVAFLLGVIVAYMVLASQFNSFLHPVTVLLALPFSISGAVWALHAADLSLNLYSAIG
jgi:multidrug efflux pump subunit AcrB